MTYQTLVKIHDALEAELKRRTEIMDANQEELRELRNKGIFSREEYEFAESAFKGSRILCGEAKDAYDDFCDTDWK